MVADSIEVQISSSAKEAVDSLDKLSAKLNEVCKSIMGIGNAQGLKNLASVFDKISPSIKEINANAEKMGKELNSTLSNFASKYKDLGKDFQFFSNAQSIEKQIEKYSNALENAKLKKEDLEKSGKISGQAYEDAVKDTYKYTNILENLKKQLEDIKTAQANFDIKVNLGDAERTLESFREQLSDFDKIIEAGGAETEAGLSFPVRGLEISLEQLRSLYPEAHELISSFEAEIERASELPKKTPMMQYGEIDLSAFEQVTQKIAEDIGVNSQMMKDFRENLNQLVIPPIQTQSLDKLYGELSKTEQKIEELRAKLENGITMGKITESVDDSGFRNLQEQIALAEQKVAALRDKISEVGTQSVKFDVSSVNIFSAALSKLGTVANVVKKGLSGFASAIMKVVSAIGKGLGKIGSFAKSLSGLSKSSKTMNVSLAGGFKTILKYGLGIRSVYILVNKLRSAVKEGMKNLVQYSDDVNASVSLLRNSLNQTKNALAAGFAPALNALAPVLNNLIQLFIRAVNAVNQLTSALLGKSTWIKAKQLTDDYRDSLNKAGKAAKGAVREFDELKVITTQDNGGSGDETPAEDMFETVEVETDISDFAERLKEMWRNADFTDLGEIIGEKLRNALNNIDWDLIKETFAKVGVSLATLINGFIETPGLSASIGRTVGESINTGVAGAKAFFDNTEFLKLGQSVADTLNSAMETTEWGEVAETVSLGIKGALDTAIGFLEEFDWKGAANSISEFIANIDWGSIFGRLGLVILVAFQGAFSFGNQLWQNLSSWLADFFRSIGWDSVAGFFKGFTEEIKKYGAVIKHGLQQIIDWTKEKLGIHSPSTVFAEIGGYLMEGLFNGISSWFEKVISVFSDLKDSVLGVWNNIKEKTTEVWNDIKDAIKVPVNGILGFINGLVNGVESGLNFMINALNKLSFDVPDWVPVIGGSKFGFDIPTINIPEIPLLAKGGVTISETLAMIGERGKEAVLPLTNSTAMKEIAGAISIPLIQNLNAMPRYTVSEMPTPYQPSYSAISAQMGGYNGSSFGGSSSSEIRDIMYRAVYDAVSASIDNSKMLKDIKHDIEDGRSIQVDGREIANVAINGINDKASRLGHLPFDIRYR